MAKLLQEAKTVLLEGDAAVIAQFSARKDVKSFLYDLKRSPEGLLFLQDNLETFLEICRGLASRTSEIREDPELFSSIKDITDKLNGAYSNLLAECEELAENSALRCSVIDLFKITLESGSPSLIDSFSGTLERDEYILWEELEMETCIEILKILFAVLPRVVVRVPKRAVRHRPDRLYHAVINFAFYNIINRLKPKDINGSLQELLVEITNYCVDKCLIPNNITDNSNPYYLILLSMLSDVCWKNVDFCVLLMPTLEKLKESELAADSSINAQANNCLRNIMEKRSNHIDANSVQKQIDVYLKEGKEDDTQVTPALLLKVYGQHSDTIHRNLHKLISTAEEMPLQHSVQICMLLKDVATQNPQVIDAELLSNIYSWLSSDMFVYYTLEALSMTSRYKPEIIDVSKITEYAVSKPLYMYTVCEVLTQIGISKSTTPSKAGYIIGWLLPQCLNPVNFSHRQAMLGCAKAIGQIHKNQLMQLKPLILTLNTNPAIKDITASMLDFLEDRSLVGVSERVETNTVQIATVSTNLEETNEALNSVVNEHSEEIRELSADVQETKEDVKAVRAELAEAMIDIERIDRKTVNTTPKWSHGVAEKLNPTAPTDWRLMAKRLGYSNDDLRSWASHESPCMSVLVEWFATHISSEATRAVYIVLKEMNREDAAHIVADAMEMAGEMIPVDEPLDLTNPPSVFISYQWGVQDKAKTLKDYLTDAGFSCWLDIGNQYV